MFKLSIVTPEKIFYEGDVSSLVVPGTDGYLGILSSHAPLITSLKPGKVELTDADNHKMVLSVTNGFLEVSNNTASLLCDAAELAEEIDLERAQKALERAKDHLKQLEENPNVVYDPDTEKAAIERAENRLRIGKEHH